VTGRRPFEHTNPDAAVIQKVLSGTRPDRPTVGFSDALWTLLTQTWLEERESSDSPSARPNIADILERLQDEAENWSPTSRQLAPPIPMERKTSCMSSTPSELAYVWLTRKSQRRVKKFMKKFGGRDQQPPRLSDKLVPERDDEVKWYETLFPKPQKSAATRKQAQSTTRT
jgi:hypothetical protein